MNVTVEGIELHISGTALNSLFEIDGNLVYVTKRFDNNPDNTRKLQEEFTQLLDRSKETHGKDFKYEEDVRMWRLWHINRLNYAN